MKKTLIILLLVVLFVGCNSKDKEKDNQSNKPVDNTSVDTSKVQPLTNIDDVVIEGKLIKGFNLFKNNFAHPKTGESMKRSIVNLDKKIPIKIFNTEKNQSSSPAFWYKCDVDENGDVLEFNPIGDITSDEKFEKDTVYALQIVYDLDEGYTILSPESMEKYNLADNYIPKSFLLNGATTYEFRIPDPTTGPSYSNTFIFPKTK